MASQVRLPPRHERVSRVTKIKIRVEKAVSDRMRNVRSTKTEPELALRRALRARRVSFNGCNQHLPGKPDLILTNHKIAIFVDGDFWHGLQWMRRGHASLEHQFKRSKSSRYWVHKIRQNMQRDCRVTGALIEKGWRVIRFWESDVQKNPDACITRVMEEAEGAYGELPHFGSKTCAEFFAGIGLMRLGLERQGWSILFANDIDRDKFDIYRSNFNCSDGHFIHEDIHRLSASQIPSVTLATASFPCNDLSLAGGRKGLRSGQSSAFWGFVDILSGLSSRKPPLILLENVTGFLSSHGGKDFADAMRALNELGYCVDPFILDAASFVPQSRQRLFVVGFLRKFSGPTRSEDSCRFFESQVRPKALADFILDHPEIDWAIRQLPAPPKSSKRLTDVLEDVPRDSNIWWNEERTSYLLNQMNQKHRTIADKMMSGRSWSYGTVFRRIRNGKSMAELRTDGIAGCLRTPRGGSGRQILLKAGKGVCCVRLLTARECARLMGADDFKLNVSLNQALFGFGDAVCVPVIEWIATHYLNPIVNELLHGRVLGKPATPSRQVSVAA
jgi:DNA (cytosine-5)-methyltransferase 1